MPILKMIMYAVWDIKHLQRWTSGEGKAHEAWNREATMGHDKGLEIWVGEG